MRRLPSCLHFPQVAIAEKFFRFVRPEIQVQKFFLWQWSASRKKTTRVFRTSTLPQLIHLLVREEFLLLVERAAAIVHLDRLFVVLYRRSQTLSAKTLLPADPRPKAKQLTDCFL